MNKNLRRLDDLLEELRPSLDMLACIDAAASHSDSDYSDHIGAALLLLLASMTKKFEEIMEVMDAIREEQ